MDSQRTDLIADARIVTPAELLSAPHARMLDLEALLPVLASPDSARALTLDSARHVLSDGTNVYPMREDLPLLVPARLQPFFTDRLAVPCARDYDAFLQYFLLATIRQSGEINASSDDIHFQRHLFRMRRVLGSCRGMVLDVGCDDPQLSAGLLPPGTTYVGLDPFCERTRPFRLVGVAEYLPFLDGSVDSVIFNTSLDHIFDWHRALDEAHRVLVPGGRLFLATLVWTSRASLLTDSVHFHHFREAEIFDALTSFDLEPTQRYDYKGDQHRHGLYLCARKRVARAV
jgi:SAM-dependent methyltransferase